MDAIGMYDYSNFSDNIHLYMDWYPICREPRDRRSTFSGVPTSQPGCHGMQLSGYESWVLLAGAMISQYIDQTFQVPKMEVLMYVSCMDANYVSMKRLKKNGDIL